MKPTTLILIGVAAVAGYFVLQSRSTPNPLAGLGATPPNNLGSSAGARGKAARGLSVFGGVATGLSSALSSWGETGQGGM